MLSSCSSSDDGLSFEEEFVGPMMDMEDDRDAFSGEYPEWDKDYESGLPPSPPMDSILGLDTQVEDTRKPTLSMDSSGPVEVVLVDKIEDNPLHDNLLPDNSHPGHNVSLGHQNNIGNGNSEDKELDELFSSFQKLFDGDGIGEKLNGDKKIKEAATKCIGEQLGFDFRIVSSNLDGQRSS
ncbi:hypothetical protein Tco_0071145 [Tanacetum coccineum]